MNNNQILKRKKNLKLALQYILMAFSVIITVMFMVFFMLGYRFDANNGQIEQHAFLQFNSMPIGATVKVDGVELSTKTPTKTSLPAGKHQIIMQKNGYNQWQKTVEIKSGTMTWLDYAILVPTSLSNESLANFVDIYKTLSSDNRKSMIIQEKSSDPTFTYVDLNNDVIKSTKDTLAQDLYTTVANPATSVFNLYRWDFNGRYVLINHVFDNQNEWIVLDTQDASRSKNISKIFDIAITDIDFSGTNSDLFYVLNAGDLRKINLSEETISKQLISNVKSFDIDHETNIISYTATSPTETSSTIVGVYRDGDLHSHPLRTIAASADVKVVATHYFNEDYVAILSGKSIDILRGIYPNSQSEDSTSLKLLRTLDLESSAKAIGFSPNGQYLVATFDEGFKSYDLEYNKESNIQVSGSATQFNYGWLSDDYMWTDRDGKLNIFEFDGQNIHQIGDVASGNAVTLIKNQKYIYSFAKNNTTYQLQRARLILP